MSRSDSKPSSRARKQSRLQVFSCHLRRGEFSSLTFGFSERVSQISIAPSGPMVNLPAAKWGWQRSSQTALGVGSPDVTPVEQARNERCQFVPRGSLESHAAIEPSPAFGNGSRGEPNVANVSAAFGLPVRVLAAATLRELSSEPARQLRLAGCRSSAGRDRW